MGTELPRTAEGQVALPPTAADMGRHAPEQTVREQLAVALEAMGSAISPDVYRKAAADLGRMEVAETAFRLARLALDRHRAEPEGDIHTIPCEKCRGTGARHVAGEPTQEPCGECSGEGVVCKPENGFRRKEALRLALDELFQEHYWDFNPNAWKAAEEAFEAAQSELQCPDGCDTSCSCYQEGLEAQREPAGRGTA